MRLDRFLSEGTGTPRREVQRWLRSGDVAVNGITERDGGRHVAPGADVVTHQCITVQVHRHITMLLHKPAGYVCATDDGHGLSVLHLVAPELRHPDLHPIGRLDKDTTGALLLTTDGALTHALTHPKRHVEKVYLADLERDLDESAVRRFQQGLVLADGTRCVPAVLERLAPLRVRIVLREGKYHQVKRMVAACGGSVARLHRERVGSQSLAGLPEGAVRVLDSVEMAALTKGRA
jgi:16S rRNA pseudouridine516 synthase